MAVKVALINLLYLVGALVGLMVGVYGLFIFIVTAIIGSRFDLSDFHISSLYQYGLFIGLPLTLGGLAYLIFATNLLIRDKFRQSKYKAISWVTALIGLIGVCLLAYVVNLMMQGL